MGPALRTALASAALLLGGAAALGTVTDHFRAFTTETARRLAVQRQPVELPAVVLQTQSGARLTLTDFRGKWLLVDFIYTRCPTYCVALGGEFAQLQRLLAQPIAAGQVALLSISFDPAHDTPRELAAYQQRFLDRGAGWTAARPVRPEGLGQLERAFGVTVIPNPLGGYTHNDAVHVVDPRGRLVEILDMDDPQLVVETLRRRLAR
jgi:protein SCO1